MNILEALKQAEKGKRIRIAGSWKWYSLCSLFGWKPSICPYGIWFLDMAMTTDNFNSKDWEVIE